MKRGIAVLALLLLLVVAGASAQQAAPKRTAVGFYFDTVVTLSAYTADEKLLDEALGECARYEGLLSKTVEGSDVWKINHAGGEPVEIAPETSEVIGTALEVSRLSGGAFDMTVAPAVALWDFTSGAAVLPDAEAVAEAARKIDYTKVTVEDGRVTLPADMQIDLGGVAKGYIADQIADFLRARGVTSALLNFGGNVVTIGEKPDGAGPWRVGVQNPEEPRGDFLIAVTSVDSAIVTSGVYERGFDLDGVRYHHLLDPDTGWPAQNELASVTILTVKSGYADALSTASFVLGLEKGARLIESLEGVEAIFITNDGQILTTSGASAFVV